MGSPSRSLPFCRPLDRSDSARYTSLRRVLVDNVSFCLSNEGGADVLAPVLPSTHVADSYVSSSQSSGNISKSNTNSSSNANVTTVTALASATNSGIDGSREVLIRSSNQTLQGDGVEDPFEGVRLDDDLVNFLRGPGRRQSRQRRRLQSQLESAAGLSSSVYWYTGIWVNRDHVNATGKTEHVTFTIWNLDLLSCTCSTSTAMGMCYMIYCFKRRVLVRKDARHYSDRSTVQENHQQVCRLQPAGVR
jgi:hypothetical protein